MGRSGGGYIQFRLYRPGHQLIGIGTVTPGQKLDVAGKINTTAVTTPNTGNANMVAAAYGNVYSNATNGINNSSGNCTMTHTIGSGVYSIAFNSANLVSANIGLLPVSITLFGNTPGFATFNGGPGLLIVYTFAANGTPADRGFGFTLYQP